MTASHAENTQRIAKNTLLLYVRMLFSMLVSLYTSRIVLNALGVEDYGIYNVVGGLVSMFSVVSISLSSAVSRFLTFELGRGDTERLKRVFSTSVMIHLALAMIVLALAETVGMWFLNTQMNIPSERLPAARWVLHASAFNFALSLWAVPYNASIISHEKMGIYAYYDILSVALKLAVVLFIAYAPFVYDRLIVYALLLLGIGIVMRGIYTGYCKKHFEESHFRFRFDRECWKEIGSFAGWNFIGSTAGLLKDQGVNILMNIFFGPVINAARGIASAVNSAVMTFANNFMMAVRPQITKSYASGDNDYTMSLVERGSRFSFYILFVLSLPILFETDFILTLWLKQYPEHTVWFVRFVLLLSMCDILSSTLITLQSATGKIRDYQLVVGGIILLDFPLSWICLEVGFAPEAVYVVSVCISLFALLFRLVFLRKMAGLDIMRFLKNVCANVAGVSLAALVMPTAVFFCIPEDGWLRFVSVGAVSVASAAAAAFFIGCTKNEKEFLVNWAKSLVRRK